MDYRISSREFPRQGRRTRPRRARRRRARDRRGPLPRLGPLRRRRREHHALRSAPASSAPRASLLATQPATRETAVPASTSSKSTRPRRRPALRLDPRRIQPLISRSASRAGIYVDGCRIFLRRLRAAAAASSLDRFFACPRPRSAAASQLPGAPPIGPEVARPAGTSVTRSCASNRAPDGQLPARERDLDLAGYAHLR